MMRATLEIFTIEVLSTGHSIEDFILSFKIVNDVKFKFSLSYIALSARDYEPNFVLILHRKYLISESIITSLIGTSDVTIFLVCTS